MGLSLEEDVAFSPSALKLTCSCGYSCLLVFNQFHVADLIDWQMFLSSHFKNIGLAPQFKTKMRFCSSIRLTLCLLVKVKYQI